MNMSSTADLQPSQGQTSESMAVHPFIAQLNSELNSEQMEQMMT